MPDPTTDGANAGVMADAGNAANILQYGGMSYNVVANQVVPGGDPDTQFAGLWFVFDIIGEGDVTIFDANWNSISYTYVPEPMSMVLLGLGGLFLRRRK